MYNSQFPILQYNHWLNKQKDKFVSQTKNVNVKQTFKEVAKFYQTYKLDYNYNNYDYNYKTNVLVILC